MEIDDLGEDEGFGMLGVIAAVVVVGAVLIGGAIKVRNELQMTKAYDRQAAALERIADATERGVLIEQGCGQ